MDLGHYCRWNQEPGGVMPPNILYQDLKNLVYCFVFCGTAEQC